MEPSPSLEVPCNSQEQQKMDRKAQQGKKSRMEPPCQSKKRAGVTILHPLPLCRDGSFEGYELVRCGVGSFRGIL